MTAEIRETKERELSEINKAIYYLRLRIKKSKLLISDLSTIEDISDEEGSLEGFKFLLKGRKKERDRIQEELAFKLEQPTKKQMRKALLNFKKRCGVTKA